MSIRIKHGAALEGRAMAYGAVAQAAYIKQQKEEQKKAEEKAGKLGDIGSALGIAGSVASFIPGGQLVGAGLTIAGGALGQMSGGQGNVGLKVASTTAQGISSIYQAQQSKIEAREQEWEDWKKRQDYTHELSSLRKQETLDQQVQVRDQKFIQKYRADYDSYVNKHNALLDAVNLSEYRSFSLEAMDKALLENKGPQGNAYRQAKSKLYELRTNYREGVKQLNQARQEDPTMTMEKYRKDQEEKAESEQKRLADERKTLEKQQIREETAARQRSSDIRTNMNIVADVEAEISRNSNLEDDDEKKWNQETLKAKMDQRNAAASIVNQNLSKAIKVRKAQLANGDPQLMMDGLEAMVQERAQELLAKNKALTEKYYPEDKWGWKQNMELAGLTAYYEGIARNELKQQIQSSGTSILDYMAEQSVKADFGMVQ